MVLEPTFFIIQLGLSERYLTNFYRSLKDLNWSSKCFPPGPGFKLSPLPPDAGFKIPQGTRNAWLNLIFTVSDYLKQ